METLQASVVFNANNAALDVILKLIKPEPIMLLVFTHYSFQNFP